MALRESTPDEPSAALSPALLDPATFAARPLPQLSEGRYRIRFAEDGRDLERVLRLRFEVFNLEMDEGLESSYSTGLDFDPFDLVCDHLMVEEASTGLLVGTYRMQTASRRAEGLGLYCAQEFDLSGVRPELLEEAVELGRACVAKAHRNGHVLYSLWRGLAAFCVWTERRYLFGCCSLTSQDPAEGRAFERYLGRAGKLHPEVSVLPWSTHSCGDAGPYDVDEPDPEVPTLFGTYLRYGALACGPPAIDREFKTIDFLVLLDRTALDLRVRRMFFAGIPEHRLAADGEGARGSRG